MTPAAAPDPWAAAEYARNARFVSDYGASLVDLLAPQHGERILDVGCGDGVLTAQIAACGAEVVGVDSSPSMVAAARERGIDARLARAEALPFAGEFDAVFSNAALHWVPAATAALAGIRRALRPGGRLVVEQGGDGNVASVRAALIRELRDGHGIDTDLGDIWYFPRTDTHAVRLARAGFGIRRLLHFHRPTPVDAMQDWLHTLAAPVLALLPAAGREAFAARVAARLEPELRQGDGKWWVDYARLRYAAIASEDPPAGDP